MPAKRNQMVPNAHFHKQWQKYVRTWFNQPARKKRRHTARVEKARRIAPRPVAGALRPVVQCPTIRYNTKSRLGRGFTLDELKAAKINRDFARTIGISVDHRRKNRSVESLQRNVQRLKEYRSKLILFPKKAGKPKADEASAAEINTAKQLQGKIMPIVKTPVTVEVQPITENMAKFTAFTALRQARTQKKLRGLMEKKAREAAEAAK